VPGEWKVGQSGGGWDFQNIYQCNYFLQTVIPRWKNGEISGMKNNIDHYIGEMYFFRAWEYFEKLQEFGDFPIVRKILPDNMESLVEASKRAPMTEVTRFIIADLDSAINLMLPNSPDGAKNRLSKPSAQLLKSRVALYQATWLKYFKNTAFVPNGPGWLGASKDYNKNYNFQAGSIDAEIAWLLDEAMSAASAVADNTPLVANNQILQQSPAESSNPYFDMFSAVDMSGFSEVLLWRRFDRGLGIMHNVPVKAQTGNSAIGTTRAMVDGFLMKNGLPVYDENSGYHGDDFIADVRKDRDGRLWLFLKEPGQLNVLSESPEGTHATPVEPVPDLTHSSDAWAYSTGYSIRKGLNYDAAQAANAKGYTGCIIFRGVEAYLNYMEACYEKNGSLDAKARGYWVQIRQRAGVDESFEKTINATVMTEEAKNDWGAYSAGSLIDPTLYNIRRERRCELMAEGFREMDLKRWRAMDQMISTPYQIEGFKLWGPMQEWYKDESGKSILIYGNNKANVSSPTLSEYLRPLQISGKELVYNGYRWHMAHYLAPIAIQHFLITSQNNELNSSPIYQNPGWPLTANSGPIN
jgi:starch-binding outer membrane protein, SusD/RagB family